MNTLVVFCHPCDDSYGARVRDVVIESLREHHHVELVDLYEGNELPITDAAGVATAIEAVVLVYPTWWSTLPAPLLAWVEAQAGALGTVRRIVAVTSHGSSRFVNLLERQVGRRLVLGGLRSLAAPDARARFIAVYGIDGSSHRKRAAFARRAAVRVRAALR
jgi:putative NADPH-quinone reductase